MSRNFKAFGLALVAVVVLAAVTASGAMALTPKVQVGTGDGNVTGTQIGVAVVTIPGGRTFQCEVVKGSGSLAAASTTVTGLLGVFEKCTSSLAGVKVPVTVTTNGCTGTVHVGATTGTADEYGGTGDLVCPAGKVIEVHVYKEGTLPANHKTENQLCGYAISPQTELGGPTATNITTATPKDIEATSNLSKMKYTRTLGTIPNCGAASGEGSLVGKATLTGTTTAGVATDLQIVEV